VKPHPEAAVSNGMHTVVVERGPGTDEVFERVLMTLEILP
jgi:hypothetical protein